MQSIDTHPAFMRQTVDRRQHAFLAESRRARLEVAAAGTPAHGRAGDQAGSPRGPRLEQLARRVRSALGVAA